MYIYINKNNIRAYMLSGLLCCLRSKIGVQSGNTDAKDAPRGGRSASTNKS